MKINEVSGELIAKMGLMTNMMKQSAGDGLEFQIMLQSMLESMGEVQDKQNNNEIMTTSVGQQLEELKLVLKEQGGYNDTQWNSDLKEVEAVSSANKVERDENPTETKKRIYDAVDKYSKQYGIDPNFALAVIKTESNFNPNVTSHAGAMGVMQLMPGTAEYLGVTAPYNIEQNVKGGIDYLSRQLKKYGSMEMALMAYNGGSGTMAKRGVKGPEDLYKMPKETQNYVPKVLGYYKEFSGN